MTKPPCTCSELEVMKVNLNWKNSGSLSLPSYIFNYSLAGEAVVKYGMQNAQQLQNILLTFSNYVPFERAIGMTLKVNIIIPVAMTTHIHSTRYISFRYGISSI